MHMSESESGGRKWPLAVNHYPLTINHLPFTSWAVGRSNLLAPIDLRRQTFWEMSNKFEAPSEIMDINEGSLSL